MVEKAGGAMTAGDNVTKDDRVYVTDKALAMMRDLMRAGTGKEPAPNHYGTVEEVWDDGTVLINFDEDGVEGGGNCAPYPADEVRLLPEPVGATP
jgi:hypothetical protein